MNALRRPRCDSASARAARRAERREAGVCIECGGKVVRDRKRQRELSLCSHHRELNNRRSREAHERARRARGAPIARSRSRRGSQR